MKVSELRGALRKLGLPTSGDKKALEKRLEEAQQDKGSEGELVRGPDGAMRVRMKQMFEEGTFSDITINIPGTANGEPGQELELHRNVLAHSCEYFRGMLTREFREVSEEKVDVQVAAGSSVSATASVLKYLYTGEVKVNGENVFEILSAADKLQLDHLRQSCVGYLERSLCPANVCSVLKACQALSLAELETQCSQVIEDNGKAVLESGGLNELEKAAVVAIISNEKLTAKEEEVFEAVASWGEARKGSGTAAAAVADFIPHIRFDEMEHAFLHQRVRQSGLVPKDVLLDALLKIMDEARLGKKRAFGSGSDADAGRPKKRRRGNDSCTWEWDASSPLLSGCTKQFELSGEGNSIATKMDKNGSYDNALVTSRVMESGKHRISFKVTEGEAEDAELVVVGVVRDGAAWNVDHVDGVSTDSWFMDTSAGSLWGNGKDGSDSAGRINDDQILSMELDADAGTLQFWVDGKRHGPGYTSGVKGHLRWATCVCDKYSGAQIVPTPELE